MYTYICARAPLMIDRRRSCVFSTRVKMFVGRSPRVTVVSVLLYINGQSADDARVRFRCGGRAVFTEAFKTS